MAISSADFRERYDECAWIFDLFAHGYDFLNGRFFPHSDPALEDAWEAEEAKVTQHDIQDKIARADGLVPDIVRDYLDLPGGDGELGGQEFCIRLFSILSAIDRAAGDVNYLGTYLAGQWKRTNNHLDRKKHLQDKASGYVVLKPRYFEQPPAQAWLKRALKNRKVWREIPIRGRELSASFKNLQRIAAPPQDCDLDFGVLSATQDFHKMNWDDLRVGIVPLISELNVRESDAQLLPGPLVLKQDTLTPSTFGIHVDGGSGDSCSDLCQRAGEALRHLAAQGCQVVLFPEMVMPDPIVAHLKRVLRELARQDQPRPGLVLCGSFTRLMPEYSTTQPFNVAVVLSHCGDELWRQRKMQPYEMKEHEQVNFGLHGILKSASCQENIAFSHRALRVVDSRATGLRMVVLICEDATRDPGLLAVRELAPNLILAPVMAGSLEPSGGFGDSVTQTLTRTRGFFVVANSAALARASWGTKVGSPALALVGLPVLSVAEQFRPLVALRELQPIPSSSRSEVLIYEFPG